MLTSMFKDRCSHNFFSLQSKIYMAAILHLSVIRIFICGDSLETFWLSLVAYITLFIIRSFSIFSISSSNCKFFMESKKIMISTGTKQKLGHFVWYFGSQWHISYGNECYFCKLVVRFVLALTLMTWGTYDVLFLEIIFLL